MEKEKNTNLIIKYNYLTKLNWIRKQCFTSDHFKGCIDALLLTDELEIIKNYIKQANGSQPPVLNHTQQSDDSEESLENYSIYSRKWKKNTLGNCLHWCS